jgi:prepilin-type processing-associated H-X9-DG protein/prepilin-type N-terminal cleavage/methylation domain-containing protein
MVCRVRAFTLIELLVVIAIIALLIGILIPALGSARKNARSLKCASQMQQVAVGWTMYAEENQDVAVPGQVGRYTNENLNVYFVGNGYQYRPRWYVQLGAVTGFYALADPQPDIQYEHSAQVNNPVFLCPEAADWTSTRNSPYGYNYQFLGNARFFGDNENSPFIRFPVRASTIDASRTVMAADCLGTAAGKPAHLRVPNLTNGDRHPQLLAEGGHGYSLDPPRLTSKSDYADPKFPGPEHRSAPHERHLRKANFSFCDGHVETRSAQDMGYIRSGDGSFASFDPEATNARFSGDGVDRNPPDVGP